MQVFSVTFVINHKDEMKETNCFDTMVNIERAEKEEEFIYIFITHKCTYCSAIYSTHTNL